MTRAGIVSLTALAACLLSPHATHAQGERIVRRIVVSVQGGGERGAGVVIGQDAAGTYIVTAAHVVSSEGVFEPTAQITFGDGSTGTAHVDLSREDLDLDLDMAVLTVPATEVVPDVDVSDRMGDVRALRFGDRVYAIGCPGSLSRCWEIAADEDQYQDSPFNRLIAFNSQSIEGGSSGGALFNGQWEVLGIVLSKDPPFGQALPIDVVRDEVQGRVPFGLSESSVPRSGYRTTVGTMLLLNGNEMRFRAPARLPSGRVSLVRRLSGPWSWHVAGQRFAPDNLAIMGALGGLGFDIPLMGWLGVRPFAELGFGAVTSRYDIGGYLDGQGRYVPSYRRLEGGSAGWGFGLSTSAVLGGNIIGRNGAVLEIQAGRWSFPTPLKPEGVTTGGDAPELDGFWLGLGLRYGMRR